LFKRISYKLYISNYTAVLGWYTIQKYNKSIELDPRFAIAYNNRGIALFNLTKFNESIKDFEMAINIDPNYADAWYNYGNALCQLNRTTEANDAFNKARDLKYSKSGNCQRGH
jgi:tetratricopeptide (TPR) repeat protein